MTDPLISADALRSGCRPCRSSTSAGRWPGPPRGATAAGHVPGAVYVDLDADLAAPPGAGGRHPLPDAGDFEAAMRRAGVRDDRPVVVYDDWQRARGGPRVVAAALPRPPGGPRARRRPPGWVAAGGDLETGTVERRARRLRAVPGHRPRDHADQVPEVDVLLDAAGPERFRGEVEPVDPVAGHIPGACNVPTAWSTSTTTATSRDPASCRDVYAAVGADPGVDVAAYCGSGVTAAHDRARPRAGGRPGGALPGSWSDWITDPDRPVAARG